MKKTTKRKLLQTSSPSSPKSISPINLSQKIAMASPVKKSRESVSPAKVTKIAKTAAVSSPPFSQEIKNIMAEMFGSPKHRAMIKPPIEHPTPISGVGPFDSPPRSQVMRAIGLRSPLSRLPPATGNMIEKTPSKPDSIDQRELLYANKYSAVIRPPISDDNPNYIGKLYLTPSHFVQEKNLLPILEKVDPSRESLLYGVKYSMHSAKDGAITQIGFLPNADEFRDSLQNQKVKKNKVYEMIMPYGGNSLETMVEKGVATFEKWYRQILKGLHLLQEAKLVHQDLHKNNIVIDDTGRARIIDFSVAMPYHMVFTEQNDQLDQFSIVNPPEYSMFRGTHHYGTWHNALENEGTLALYKELHGYSTDSALKSAYLQVAATNPMDSSDKVDMYSFAILVLTLIAKNKLGRDFYEKHKKQLRSMSMMNPTLRNF